MQEEATYTQGDLRQMWVETPKESRHIVGRDRVGRTIGVLARTEKGGLVLDNHKARQYELVDEQKAHEWFYWPYAIQSARPGKTFEEYFGP